MIFNFKGTGEDYPDIINEKDKLEQQNCTHPENEQVPNNDGTKRCGKCGAQLE